MVRLYTLFVSCTLWAYSFSLKHLLVASHFTSIEGFPCIGRGFEAIDKLLGNETAHKQSGNASVARTQYDTQLAKTRRKKEMLEESKRRFSAEERLRMNQKKMEEFRQRTKVRGELLP